jgi:ribose/xylose/arabinose/galactoside ABC-type transport system permease subunit
MNKNKTLRFIKDYKSLAILIVIVILAAVLTSGASLDVGNLQNLLLQVSIQGIVGFGMTYSLLCGEFDLAVGAILTTCGIIFAKICLVWGFFPALLVTLAVGAVFGLFDGFLVNKLGLPSFIATLGSSYIIKGIGQVISQGQPTSVGSDEFVVAMSNLRIGGFAIFPFIFILVGLICAYHLKFTRFGRNIYATGGNYEVAKNSGIKVDFYKIMSFVIVCVSAALAGVLTTVRLQSATAIAGDNLNLTVIGAVIIGGTSTAGGIGNIPMSFIGLLTMGVLTNTLSVMGISGYWQQVVQGLIMVIVIGSSSFANYRKTSSV